MEKYLPWISVGLALLIFFITHFRTKSGSDLSSKLQKLEDKLEASMGDIEDLTPLKEAIGSLRSEVEVLKKQVSLFWSMIEKQMSQMLHSPHRPTLDALLDKNIEGVRLTQEEACVLLELLQKLIDSGELSKGETSFAVQLMAVTSAKYNLENYA